MMGKHPLAADASPFLKTGWRCGAAPLLFQNGHFTLEGKKNSPMEENERNRPPENEPENEEQKQFERALIESERWQILEQIEDWLEVPVLVLGLVWLVLVILDFTTGLSPFLNMLVYVIWGVFILDFALRFLTAPRKLIFLRANWLTALSLFIPALRIGRIARLVRVFRALRGARVIALVGSVNRSMRVLRVTLQKQGFGYVLLLTLVITLAGAAGIYAFEGPLAPQHIGSYGESLYWSMMVITTMGTDYWPRSAEGRLLTLLMAVYGFAVFGYVTATIASFFIGQKPAGLANEPAGELSPELQAELRALRAEVGALREMLRSSDDPDTRVQPPHI